MRGLGRLSPHAARNRELHQQGKDAVLRVVLWTSASLFSLLAVVAPTFSPQTALLQNIYFPPLTIILISLLLFRCSQTRLASMFLSTFLWIYAVVLACYFGGARAPHLITFFPVILIAGMVWSERAAIAMTALSCLAVFGMAWAEVSGLMPTPVKTGAFRMSAAFSAGLVMTAILLLVGLRSLRSAQKDLEFQAFHDSLTGLPNRAALHRDFPQHLLRALKMKTRIAMILLDLDRFKEINDTLGHHTGDKLLKDVGPRLLSGRQSLEVYRLGGDEFVAVIPDVRDQEDAVTTTAQILEKLDRPFPVGDITLSLSASAGVATHPEHGRDSHELLRCADVAMYQSKRTVERVEAYRLEIDKHSPTHLSLSAELRRAMNREEFILYFQPQVRLVEAKVQGFEALIRWRHSKLGLVAPSEFIGVAELGDIIQPLTYWVVENALRQLRAWQAKDPSLRMSINLSGRNLLHRDFSDRLAELIRESAVDPQSIEFELTETALMTDLKMSAETMRRIACLGARMAIDDFGTGFSTLASLKRFEIHTLKIDRSFVSDMLVSNQSRAIVLSIIQMAMNLELAVVAEGVEDAPTCDALRAMGCELAQGFFFSPPAPADELHRS